MLRLTFNTDISTLHDSSEFYYDDNCTTTTTSSTTVSWDVKAYVLAASRISFETFLALSNKKGITKGRYIFKYIYLERPEDLRADSYFIILDDFLLNPRASDFLKVLGGKLLYNC